MTIFGSGNTNGGRDPKMDYQRASILGCRGKLAGGSRGAVVGISFDVAGRGILILPWVVGGCLVMAVYLMRPDETLRESTAWIRENIPAGDLVIIKTNNSVYTRKNPQLPGFGYRSGRRTWI